MPIKFACLVFALTLLGCAKTNEPESAAIDVPETLVRTDPAQGPDGPLPNGPQPPGAADVQITLESPPEAICRAFIDCLRRGESAKAEKFLSQEAITQTRKHALDLAMPAGKDASYTIGEPQFATSQRKVAFISIAVNEPGNVDAPDQSFSMMLRNGSFGWKIAGMMLGPESPTQDLFSFENPLDVLRIKSMLEGDSRQARAAEIGSLNRRP